MKTLLLQTGAVAPAPGGTGPIATFPDTHTVRVIQFSPSQHGGSVTGTYEIRGSTRTNPNANDFQTLATVKLNGHQSGRDGDFQVFIPNNATAIQVVATDVSSGEVNVFGNSSNAGSMNKNKTDLSDATAVVYSPLSVTVDGQNVHVTTEKVTEQKKKKK